MKKNTSRMKKNIFPRNKEKTGALSHPFLLSDTIGNIREILFLIKVSIENHIQHPIGANLITKTFVKFSSKIVLESFEFPWFWSKAKNMGTSTIFIGRSDHSSWYSERRSIGILFWGNFRLRWNSIGTMMNSGT